MSAAMDTAQFIAIAASCAPQVTSTTAQALVSIESGFNANAIGLVGGALERQPRNQAEAVVTAKALERAGWNFSLGLAQINYRNLHRLGLSIETALEPCANLKAMQVILTECFDRAMLKGRSDRQPRQWALRQALSCYYSGNFSTGFAHGYVDRFIVAATMAGKKSMGPNSPKETP